MLEINRIYSAGLKMSAICVYEYLWRRSDKSGKCFPSINRMARDLSVSPSTIRRAIHDLERKGFIRKEHRFRENRGNTSNMYYLI